MVDRSAGGSEPERGETDASIEQLARLFREHPAWVEAAALLDASAVCGVYFRHRPGEAWRLERRGARTLLRRGAAADPDLVFRFAPGSIDALEAVEGGIGDFAVRLFELIVEGDPRRRVELRIAAGFPRLVQRGYVRLLLAAGPRVLAFGRRHGIRSLSGLRRLVSELRSREPADWEG